MNLTTIMINVFTLVVFIIAFIKDKKKAVKSLKVAMMSFVKMLPMVLIIVIIIGMLLGFISSQTISNIVGNNAGFLGIILTGLFGAVMYIPAILAFPLSASLLEGGASITAVAAFILTLTMVGVITLPIEIKHLGKKFALLRNFFSFVIAIIIAYILGVLL